MLKIFTNKNRQRFGRLCGVCAAWCKYATNIVFYICIRVRACVCVYVLNAAQKYEQKNFLKKVAKIFGALKISPYLCSIEQ